MRVRVAICFVLAFLGTVLVVRSAFWYPTASNQLLRSFGDAPPSYTTLMLGPSYVLNGIDPAIVDDTANQMGVYSRTQLDGAISAGPLETIQVLYRHLALRPIQLRWVVLDLSLDFGDPADYLIGSLSLVDLTDLDYAKRFVRLGYLGSSRKLTKILESVGTNLFGVGRISTWSTRVDREGRSGLLRSSMPRQQWARYRQAVEETPFKAACKRFKREKRLLREVARDVKKSGATLVLLVSPVLFASRGACFAHLGIKHMAFNEPKKYPELYVPEVRYNFSHLNREGARKYSEILARELFSTGEENLVAVH